MKILFTGFDKFLDHKINPTEELVKYFDGKTEDNYTVVGKVINLRYTEIRKQIREAIETVEPNIIVLSGQAPRSTIAIEKIAINYVHAKGPYNCGTIVSDEPVIDGGKHAYFSTLPVLELVDFLKTSDIPASMSLSAGSYGCNQIFYETMYYLEQKGTTIPAGFIHIPMLPEQSTNGQFPTMSFELMKQAFTKIFHSLTN